MDEVPTWKKGGLARRGVALLIDLIVAIVVTQLLASFLFPLSNGMLIDSTGIIISCEPAARRPQNIAPPPDFQPTAEKICTKSFFGQPIARSYTMSRQEPRSSVTTSISHPLGSHDQAILALDLSLLQWPLVALMRWVMDSQGWQSPGRQVASLHVLPRSDVSARFAFRHRYMLFALPCVFPVSIAIPLFAALLLGAPLPADLSNTILILANLPATMMAIAAVLAIMAGRDAFYDETAGTSVVYVPHEIEVGTGVPQLSEPRLPRTVGSSLFPVPWVTLGLAAILVAIFLGELATSFARTRTIGVTGPVLVLFGAMSGELVFHIGQWYRLVCSIFLHGSTAHLLGNIVPLVIAGWFLEPVLGAGWLLAIFMLGGLAGSIASVSLNPPGLLGIGASGAMLALVSAGFVLSFRMADDARRIWLRAFCLAIFIGVAFSGPSLGSVQVDHMTHIAGAVAGAALSLLVWRSMDCTGLRPRWSRAALATAIVFPALLFLSAPLTGFGSVSLARFLIPAEQLPKSDPEWVARSAELVRRYPRDPRSHVARALALNDDRAEREKSLALVNKTQTELISPQGPQIEKNALILVGQARLKARDWEAANDLFARAITMNAPPRSDVFGMRAAANRSLGRPEAALEDFQAQLRLQIANADILTNMADTLSAIGRHQEALEKLDAALVLNPKHFDATRSRGWFAFLDGRAGEAIAGLQRALELKPNDAYAALFLHIASVRSGQGDRIANAAANIDMQQWPAPVIRYYLGEIDAEELRRAAQNSDPVKHNEQDCEASFYIAEAYLMQSATKEAESLLNHAWEICPKTFYEWGAARAELRRIGQ